MLEIVIYETSARKPFSRMSALFEAQRTSDECAESVFANRWRLPKCQSN
jgi:hypothetical protein